MSCAAQTRPAVQNSRSWVLYRVFGGDHGSGTTFWVTSLTLEEDYTSIGASDDFFIAIFELFRENCIDIDGAARSYKLIIRSLPLHEQNVEDS